MSAKVSCRVGKGYPTRAERLADTSPKVTPKTDAHRRKKKGAFYDRKIKKKITRLFTQEIKIRSGQVIPVLETTPSPYPSKKETFPFDASRITALLLKKRSRITSGLL